MVYAFMADGSEEVECLAVVDLLRRAGIALKLVSVGEGRVRCGSHQISVVCDSSFDETDFSDAGLLFLPGGMPGTRKLGAHEGLRALLLKHAAAGGRLAAICAAPSILGELGLLNGKKACCYPGFESELKGAELCMQPCLTDGNITCGRGVGCVYDFALELIRILCGEEKAETIRESILYCV